MKPFQAQTYYELLEVPVSASSDDIRSAYGRLNEQYSDDSVALYGLVEPEHASALRARLLEAMEILCDDDLRVEYDKDLGLPPRALPPAPVKPSAPRPVVAQVEADDDEPEARVSQLAMTDLLQVADSSVPKVSFEYVAPQPPAHFTPREVPVVEVPKAPPSASVSEPVRAVEVADAPRPSAPAAAAPEPVAPPPSAPIPIEVTAASPSAPVPQPQPSAPLPVEVAAAPAPSAPPPLPVASAPIPFTDDFTEVSAPVALARRPSPSSPEVKPPPASAPEVAEQSALALIDSTRRPPPPRPSAEVPQRPKLPDIAPDAEFNGELLRRVREALGLTLQHLADKTRIGLRHLEAIEADRYDAMPATVYLRGMLMNLSRELQLDGIRVSKSYITLVERQKSKG